MCQRASAVLGIQVHTWGVHSTLLSTAETGWIMHELGAGTCSMLKLAHNPSSCMLCCCVLYGAAGDLEVSRTIVEATKLFKVTVSFGNVISLISLPCFMSHASIPAEVRAARGLPDDLVRISAGIEDVGDLIADLKQAMDKAWAEKQQRQQVAGSSSNASGAGVAAAGSNGSERMQQLEARILQLEAQLQGSQQLQNSHTS